MVRFSRCDEVFYEQILICFGFSEEEYSGFFKMEVLSLLSEIYAIFGHVYKRSLCGNFMQNDGWYDGSIVSSLMMTSTCMCLLL